MTIALGTFAYGATIGWLGVLYIPSATWPSWRAVALSGVLASGCLALCWWHDGSAGSLTGATGLVLGGIVSLRIRFHYVLKP